MSMYTISYIIEVLPALILHSRLLDKGSVIINNGLKYMTILVKETSTRDGLVETDSALDEN